MGDSQCPLSAYFYPRSPCGERRRNVIDPDRDNGHFYPRSPCGERRKLGTQIKRYYYFYPRSPCGERPLFLRCGPMMRRYFYPRSPCGERPIAGVSKCKGGLISIHALLAESDYILPLFWHLLFQFLSTLSLRRATWRSDCPPSQSAISIHALLAESDTSLGDLFQCQDTISIHALLAESDFDGREASGKFFIFLSTLSLRRATDQPLDERR